MNKEGWICPVCGKGLSPWTPECSCYKTQTTSQFPKQDNMSQFRITTDSDGKLQVELPSEYK